MSEGLTIVAFPARKVSEWETRGAWGRDAHLLQAMASRLGAGTRVVVLDRARRTASSASRRRFVGGIGAEVVPHRVELPRSARHRVAAAMMRRAARGTPDLQLEGGAGVVVCWDLARWEGAARLAEDLGWPLLTDVVDDWRLHPSMPGLHRHLEKLRPLMERDCSVLSGVTTSALRGASAAVLVPNAGFHDGMLRAVPRPGPSRPVAAYAGTIHPRLDVEILARLRERLEGWDVVVAGPVMNTRVRDRLLRADVHVADWWAIQEIDRLATVVVCPYVRTPYTHTMDPLKIYEALARGVPCVSTIPIQLEPRTGLAVVDADDFSDAVIAAADQPRERVAAAGRALGSWGQRAEVILAAVPLQSRTGLTWSRRIGRDGRSFDIGIRQPMLQRSR